MLLAGSKAAEVDLMHSPWAGTHAVGMAAAYFAECYFRHTGLMLTKRQQQLGHTVTLPASHCVSHCVIRSVTLYLV